ncbi:MAG: terminase family protein [Helicobacteraceae bacterium]|jgi:phage FluMu gp28-like protein/transposase-like protein|nr:terminase family protein [Helicobacteraceae bacterium]
MAKYTKEDAAKAEALFEAGVPMIEIARDLNVSKPTLYRWLRAYEARNAAPKETIDNLRKQLDSLSKRKPTGSIAHRIAMISAAIAKLEGAETKKARSALKARAKPIAVMSADQSALRQKALEIGGLYQYQRDFLLDDSRFRLVLKSRQIGFSYVSGLDALLGAIAGRNQLFLSASEEQAYILMRYLDGWAKKLEVTFKRDSDDEKTLENGAYIKVMAHNFRTVQGFTGDLYMDEFAWYPNPKRIWDVFLPSITACGGRITILSTPFEEHSFFHTMVSDSARYYMFSRHKVDIHRAMQDGLQVADFDELRDMCDADTWASAYECQFIDDESALLPIALIKSCVADYALRSPGADYPIYAGFDVGRVKDRSALAAVALDSSFGASLSSLGAKSQNLNANRSLKTREAKISQNLCEAPKLPAENSARSFGEQARLRLCALDLLHKATFAEQERVLGDFMRVHPLAMLKIDKTGIGMATAERLKSQFNRRAEGVYFTAAVKEALAINLKKHFEDKLIVIPNDPALIADLHAVKRSASQSGFRYDSDRNAHGHADRFWALALALSHFEIARVKRGGRAWII